MLEREQDVMKNAADATESTSAKMSMNQNQTKPQTDCETSVRVESGSSDDRYKTYSGQNQHTPYNSTQQTSHTYTENSSCSSHAAVNNNTTNDSYANQTPLSNHYTGQTTGYQSGSMEKSSNTAGYSYVNYYSNPNTPSQISGSEASPKKKSSFVLKAVAFVAAMVLVSAGSIGIYRGVQDANRLTPLQDKNDNSVSETMSEKTEEETQAELDATTENNENIGAVAGTTQSWIDLAGSANAMSITDIVAKVTPSVVGVQATFEMPSNYNYGYGFGYNYGMFGNNDNQAQNMTGIGTGIIMREDGYIVTNAHVIYDSEYGCGEAVAVEIRMSDEETTYDAEIVAYDVETDLAVLKVDQTGLPAAEFGESDTCQVGEMVVAIGNPLGLELQNTTTCGIISALNRKVTINDRTMTLIQTDTAINSGNSGGPLINSSGQVIGINSAKMSSSVSSSGATVEGIGFAIPMTEAKEILNDLINYGYVTGRPQLGITCQDVSEAVSEAYRLPIGAYIISVTEGGAAAEAGLQTGDVITAINDQQISTTEELNNYKSEYNAGDTVTLTVVRNGQEYKINVILKEVVANNN